MPREARPPKRPAATVTVRLRPGALARLDCWIAKQDDAPSRPEALRRLLREGTRPLEP